MLSAECIAGNYSRNKGPARLPAKGLPGGLLQRERLRARSSVRTDGPDWCVPGCGRRQMRPHLRTNRGLLGRPVVRERFLTKAVLNPWAGVSCSDVEDTTAKVYFHVPRATDTVAASADFYKLPFPNDIRLQNGKVSLAGHPRPGPRILPFDLVDRYITAIEAESTGFSANPTILMRLSKQFNVNAFPGDCGVSLVDITPTSPNYTLAEGLACGATNASSRYVCGPYLWARTRLGSPLRPGTTYALLVRKTITNLLGSPFGADDDFAAMLKTTAPADPALTAAYSTYLPLRNYLATGQIAANNLAAAVVFTVEKYEEYAGRHRRQHRDRSAACHRGPGSLRAWCRLALRRRQDWRHHVAAAWPRICRASISTLTREPSPCLCSSKARLRTSRRPTVATSSTMGRRARPPSKVRRRFASR